MNVSLWVCSVCTEIIHYKLLPPGETITAKKYCDLLTNLNVSVQEKRPIWENRKGVIFPPRQSKTKKTCRNLKSSPAPILFSCLDSIGIFFPRVFIEQFKRQKIVSVLSAENYLTTFFHQNYEVDTKIA